MRASFLLLLAAFLVSCAPNPPSTRLDIEYPTYEDPSGLMSRLDKDRMHYNCTRFGGLNEGSIYQASNQKWSYKCNKHPSVPKENKKITQVQTQTLNLKEDISSIRKVCADSVPKFKSEEFSKCVDTKIKARLNYECFEYWGLNEESIKKMPNQVWSYKCNGSNLTVQKEDPNKIESQAVNLSGNINGAKLRCVDLGFKAGTEDFGKCVLQLSK